MTKTNHTAIPPGATQSRDASGIYLASGLAGMLSTPKAPRASTSSVSGFSALTASVSRLFSLSDTPGRSKSGD